MMCSVYSFGVDVSKRSLDCFVLPDKKAFRVSNDEAGIAHLADRVCAPLQTHLGGSGGRSHIPCPLWSERVWRSIAGSRSWRDCMSGSASALFVPNRGSAL